MNTILTAIKTLKQKQEVYFFIKLIALYCLFYYGTLFWIGICAPGNLYSSFCEKNLNFIMWLRNSLLNATALISNSLGYKAIIISTFKIKILNGGSVNIVYSCVGYGVMSVWAAFAIAFPADKKKKIKWLFGGLFAIWAINVTRITTLLIAVNQKVKIDINKFGEHHDVFNAVAYGLIILMIIFYTKEKKKPTPSAPQQTAS